MRLTICQSSHLLHRKESLNRLTMQIITIFALDKRLSDD